MTRSSRSRLLARLAPRRAARLRWRRLLGEPGVTARPHRFIQRLRRRVTGAGRRSTTAGIAGIAAVLGAVLGGPVAGAILAGYAAVAVAVLIRRRVSLVHQRARRFAVDAVATLAADLRAGLPVTTAVAAAAESLEGPGAEGPGAAAVARRVAQSVELAASSGAPLAEVLDRLDVHLRAVDRARSAAAAQAAGARASAALLAAMPVAGVGVGMLIGADPMRVLLHTPLGAACLATASVLQLAGLAWSSRLSTIDVPA